MPITICLAYFLFQQISKHRLRDFFPIQCEEKRERKNHNEFSMERNTEIYQPNEKKN